MQDKTVGIVGLGIMGGSIARNLRAAGWRVVGYDTEAARQNELSADGIEVVADAAAVARAAPVILVSLPKPEALHATIAKIIEAGVARRVVAELSTFTLTDKETAAAALRTAGHVLLDCPLSGTGAQARTRDLVVYASGDAQSINALRPLFADFGRQTFDTGTFGNGTRMKFVANLLVAIHNVASAEAMVLGMKAGLDPHQIYELVTSGAGNSRVFELRAGMMADNQYAGDNVTMKIATWQKDMTVIADFAREIGAPTPVFNSTEAIYNAAVANGHGDHDTAAVCAVLEGMAGLARG